MLLYALIYFKCKSKKSEHYRYWVYPFWRDNYYGRGVFSAFKYLKDDDRFQSFCRMEKTTFDMIFWLNLVFFKVLKKDTNYKRPVCSRECILITIKCIYL